MLHILLYYYSILMTDRIDQIVNKLLCESTVFISIIMIENIVKPTDRTLLGAGNTRKRLSVNVPHIS